MKSVMSGVRVRDNAFRGARNCLSGDPTSEISGLREPGISLLCVVRMIEDDMTVTCFSHPVLNGDGTKKACLSSGR